MYKFYFFNDPGHGWIRVPVKLLVNLGIAGEISAYSYYRAGKAYLEEDCDYAKFAQAMAKKGIKYGLKEKYANQDSAIRRFERFDAGLHH